LYRKSFIENGMLSVRLSGSVTCMDAGKEREQGRGSFAPTKKPRIVILRKAFAVKQMSLTNVQSNA
jgi:hypothetical protein